MGTKIDATILRVIDGDTLLCKVAGKVETVRALCCDTEESKAEIKSKPVTNAGLLACEFGKQYWWGFQPVLEFDIDDPIEKCLVEQRDYFNRLVCYLWRDSENYNLRLVEEGLSPYFTKYGRSRIYHQEFTDAQENAQFRLAGIWNPSINEGGASRNYVELLPWWNLRGSIIDEFRAIDDGSVVNIAGFTPEICDNECLQISQTQPRSKKNQNHYTNKHTIHKTNNYTIHTNNFLFFTDFLGGFQKIFSDGVVVRGGTKNNYIRLWIPGSCNEGIADEINRTYTGYGRGYGYVRGYIENYRNTTQITVVELSDRSSFTSPITLSDSPSYQRKQQYLEHVRYSVRKTMRRIG